MIFLLNLIEKSHRLVLERYYAGWSWEVEVKTKDVAALEKNIEKQQEIISLKEKGDLPFT